jgi:hypothetical protein
VEGKTTHNGSKSESKGLKDSLEAFCLWWGRETGVAHGVFAADDIDAKRGHVDRSRQSFTPESLGQNLAAVHEAEDRPEHALPRGEPLWEAAAIVYEACPGALNRRKDTRRHVDWPVPTST